jgi:hypothetical protein
VAYHGSFRENLEAAFWGLQAAAFIQNWSNHHWVAYRWGSDGEIYRLDSMQLGPSRVSKAEFVASMATHWTYAIKQQS